MMRVETRAEGRGRQNNKISTMSNKKNASQNDYYFHSNPKNTADEIPL